MPIDKSVELLHHVVATPFAIGLLKSKKRNETIPEMMKKLMLNTRAVFDYLKMTRNSNALSMS